MLFWGWGWLIPFQEVISKLPQRLLSRLPSGGEVGPPTVLASSEIGIINGVTITSLKGKRPPRKTTFEGFQRGLRSRGLLLEPCLGLNRGASFQGGGGGPKSAFLSIIHLGCLRTCVAAFAWAFP